ncbi:MAG: hypothetical protein GF328_07290 [Candidatus Latescibacteria bacterium]|nr:hypothetical protein [Candidatus Latescibacterota bacterium]
MSTRMELQAAIRRMLVAHWIDVGKINIQVTSSTALLRGQLLRVQDGEPITPLVIEELEQKLSRIKGVKHVRWRLENWVLDRGKWRKKGS